MLNRIIDSLETKTYAIYDDLTYEEVETISSGFKKKPKPFIVVVKKNKGKTQSLFSNGFFAHSEYEIYNESLQEIKVNMSGWVLSDIVEAEGRWRRVDYLISDPLGEIKRVTNNDLSSNWSDYFQIDGICRIIGVLKKISIYKNWSDYRIKENKLLNASILKIKIQKLESEIKNLNDIIHEQKESSDKEKDGLYGLIGRLKVENDELKKKLQ